MIRTGDLMFVSGRIGGREVGSSEPEFRTQVTRVYDNLQAVPSAAVCTSGDVIDVTTFHTDPEA